MADARVSLESIREAAAGLVDVTERTTLKRVPELDVFAAVPVYLKLENEHATGAFKLRGAWTAVRRLSSQRQAAGVLTYSSGNHGQAVAFAAHKIGIRAVVCMPETAPAIKVDGVRRWGGEVVFAGATSEDRLRKGRELAASEGLTIIPPYDHPDIIAGQATVGLEILEQLPETAHVVVPIGGGGLAAGVAAALYRLSPVVRLTAAEPVGAAAFTAALEAGHPVRLDRCDSVADGLLPLSVGTLNFEHLREYADSVIVSDRAIAEATVWLRTEAQVPAEPSGAVSTAALRSRLLRPRGPLVLVVSGGNADPAVIAELHEATVSESHDDC